MVICLKSRCVVGMKGDAVLASTVQVFEAVEGGFVMLVGWSWEYDARNVRTGETSGREHVASQLIDPTMLW